MRPLSSLASLLVCSGLVACSGEPSSAPNDASPDAPPDAQLDAAGDVSPDTTPANCGVGEAYEPAPNVMASSTTCNPLAVTAECLPPYPSDFFTRADPTTMTGRRLQMPEGSVAVPMTARPIDMAPFNRADGFPTSEPLLVHFGVAVDDRALADYRHPERSIDAASPIALFNMATGQRVPYLAETDRNATDPARAALIIRPLEALAFNTRYAVAIRNTLRSAQGAALPSSQGFAALRDNRPSGDARIESARTRHEEVFRFLQERGFARADLQLAWDYTTASREHVLGPILAMRQEVFRRANEADGIPFTIDRVEEAPNANTARIVYGTFTPPSYLQSDNTVQFARDGQPILQCSPPSYEFTMVVPARARTATEALPLVVFGHGVFGNGRDYLSGNIGREIIQPLAESSGAVVVATDWIGLSSRDQSLLVTQVVQNINRAAIISDRLLQSLVNNLTLIELSLGALQRDARVRFNSTLIDRSRVYYYGVSLGGIQGSSLVSVSRHITRAVASVPGASWSNLLPRSIVYSPIKQLVDRLYPDPLTQAEFLGLMQGRFDHTDGVNLATMMFRAPTPDAPRGRRVILQEAIGDCQVPNFSTRILARTMGVRQLTPSVETVFGLMPAAAPSEESALAQYTLPAQLARYAPPDTNVVPAMDNDTHSDVASLRQSLDQVRDLFATGRVVQHCAESCDPD